MIVTCPNCTKKNRIPAARVDQMAKCGNCARELSATGQPVAVNGSDFQDLVDNSPLPVLVDFWAPWCGPCKMVAPEIDKLAQQLDGKVVVAKLDTEQHPQVAQQEGVQGIPMFAMYEGGKRTSTQTGYMNAEQLARAFELKVK
ncbi:MAG: thioredoxin [Bradymonadaceae bacterium]|nr:thioredoxin [Lujinxingiaceae bacterium]